MIVTYHSYVDARSLGGGIHVGRSFSSCVFCRSWFTRSWPISGSSAARRVGRSLSACLIAAVGTRGAGVSVGRLLLDALHEGVLLQPRLVLLRAHGKLRLI